MENTNKKDFGATFPNKTSNSGTVMPRPSGQVDQAGQPKSQVNAGHTFPKTIGPGSPSQYSSKK